MFDCANVEMRELLPELAAGTLDARTRSRVEQHVAACAECASELEMLRLVRATFAATPAVDVRRIVAGLPKPAPARLARGSAPLRRWVDWRVAAALTTITVGALSLAVSQRMSTGNDSRPPAAVVAPLDSPTVTVQPTPPADHPHNNTARPPAPTQSRPPTVPVKQQLAFGGGVDDLDEASIKELLGALDALDSGPIAPSAEPDRTPVLPVIKTGER